MADLFFSYARKDSTKARDNIDALRAKGFIIWQDIGEGDDGIEPGADWVATIEQSIKSRDCAGIILQWSENAAVAKGVAKEIKMGLKAKKTFYPIMLDDTPLPRNIANSNWVRHDELQRLMDTLERNVPEARRQKVPVNVRARLDEQPGAETKNHPLDREPITSVPLVKSSCTNAFLVGGADTAIVNTRHLLLCVELSGAQKHGFLADAIRLIKKRFPDPRYPDDPPHYEQYMVLHIVAKKTQDRKYHLDDSRYCEWEDAADTCVEAVEHFYEDLCPDCERGVHLFTKTPVIFAALLGTRFPAQTILYLYNDVEASTGDRYTYSQIARIVTR